MGNRLSFWASTHHFFSFSWIIAAFCFKLTPFASFIAFKDLVTSRTICFQSGELSICHWLGDCFGNVWPHQRSKVRSDIRPLGPPFRSEAQVYACWTRVDSSRNPCIRLAKRGLDAIPPALYGNSKLCSISNWGHKLVVADTTMGLQCPTCPLLRTSCCEW